MADDMRRLAAIHGATGGLKFDGGKLPWELLPEDALEEVVRVLQFGAQKYAARNWEKGIAHSRTYGAARRHMVAFFQKGERLDPETKTHHYANAICELLFALAFELRGMGDTALETGPLDDRPCRRQPGAPPRRDTAPGMPAFEPEEPTVPSTPTAKASGGALGKVGDMNPDAGRYAYGPSELERHRVGQ